MRKSKIEKYILTYLTHQELFGNISSLDDIRLMIEQQVETIVFFPILSQLGSLPQGINSSEFKRDFIKYVSGFINAWATRLNLTPQQERQSLAQLSEKVGQRALYTNQSVLNMWKYVLAYGVHDESKKPTFELFQDQYMRAFVLSLWLSDHFVGKETDALADVFRNYAFNEHHELVNALSRTMYIYTELARNTKRIGQEDFFDIDKEFVSEYGFSLEDYITAVFAIYTLFVTRANEGKIMPDWYQSVSHGFATTKLRDIASDVLKPLTFTFDEGKKAVSTSLHKWWDFSFFYGKPLFKVTDDIVLPVTLPLVENALYEGLFWKIRHCYPMRDMRFQNFFGKPFELYVADLLTESCANSPLRYEITPEFEYLSPINGQQTKSPDVMVRLGHMLLAVEAKSQRVNFFRSTIEGDLTSIESDRHKMTVEPMQQLYARVSELLSGKVPEMQFNDISEVFLIVVNNGSFPTLRPLHQKTLEDWRQLQGINVKVHMFYMSIEELELVSGFLERSTPVFKILRHKTNFPKYSFKNFLHDQRLHSRPPALCHRIFFQLPKKFADHLEIQSVPHSSRY